MSVLRFVARSMLASYFVLNGVRALLRPEDQPAAATPLADSMLPKLKSALPESVRSYLPEDATGLAKLTGALQVAGGISLATGIGRRVGAGVLALSSLPALCAANPLAKGPGQAAAQAELGTNVALLGGVLLAAQDTEGKPNLAWRLRTQRQLLASQAAKQKAELERAARAKAAVAAKAARRSGRHAKAAVAEVRS